MQYDITLSAEEQEALTGALRPSGYRLLVALPKVSEKIGSVFIPQTRASDEQTASVVVKVLALGPDAYADKDRFPHGAYCSEGDHVLIPPYAGHRMKVGDREVRIINDDSVLGIVLDVQKVSRAYER